MDWHPAACCCCVVRGWCLVTKMCRFFCVRLRSKRSRTWGHDQKGFPAIHIFNQDYSLFFIVYKVVCHGAEETGRGFSLDQGCNSNLSLAPGNLKIKILAQVQARNRAAKKQPAARQPRSKKTESTHNTLLLPPHWQMDRFKIALGNHINP